MTTKEKYDRRKAAIGVRMRLARVIQAEIDSRDWSIAELARRSGLPEQSVRWMYAGASDPRLTAALALETAFGWPAGEMSRRVSLPG